MDNSSLLGDIGEQITCIQHALSLSCGLKKQVVKLQNEKKEALEKCDNLQEQIVSMKNAKCLNCSSLLSQLMRERKEKAVLKKEQNAKVLKAIAKTLEEMNTNQMTNTNAQQLLTQFVDIGLDDSTESKKEQKTIQLLNDSEGSEDESNSNILVNETIIEMESEESSNDCNAKLARPLVVPETELTTCSFRESCKNQLFNPHKHHSGKNKNDGNLKEQRVHHGKNKNDGNLKEKRVHTEEDEIQDQAKRQKISPQSSGTNVNQKKKPKTNSPHRPLSVDIDEVVVRNPDRSPSVLSEIIEFAAESAINPRSSTNISVREEKEICWKMKPCNIFNGDSGNATGKKLKQMTLSLARPEKKHDISLSHKFKGGVANIHTDYKDIVLPSPERSVKRGFTRKQEPYETLEDPDMTVFHPAVTSTCLPVNNSFDRLPEVAKSPPYKYRRDVVRKREERLKLPGQDCDQCAKYFEAAGGDRMNVCSRHRDKYQIRANTPPGFWDPVFPSTPEDDLQSKS